MKRRAPRSPFFQWDIPRDFRLFDSTKGARDRQGGGEGRPIPRILRFWVCLSVAKRDTSFLVRRFSNFVWRECIGLNLAPVLATRKNAISPFGMVAAARPFPLLSTPLRVFRLSSAAAAPTFPF